MNILTICPCCSNTMVHYINNRRDYWFCRNCWQEMPNFNRLDQQSCDRRAPALQADRQNQILNLSIGLKKLMSVS